MMRIMRLPRPAYQSTVKINIARSYQLTRFQRRLKLFRWKLLLLNVFQVAVNLPLPLPVI